MRHIKGKDGGRLLVTELMGSSLRTREAVVLGENENRRLSEIIEGGNTYGWHSFEQSLARAYEQNLITEETALLYCVNKPQMHQRIDAINHRRATGRPGHTLKMKIDEPAPKPVPQPKPPKLPDAVNDPE